MISAMLSQRPFRSVVALAAISSLGFLGLVAPSAASAGAVHFDPNSPAGKEYALPLADARRKQPAKKPIMAEDQPRVHHCSALASLGGEAPAPTHSAKKPLPRVQLGLSLHSRLGANQDAPQHPADWRHHW